MATGVDTAMVGFSVMAIVACRSLASCTRTLRRLQFLAFTAEFSSSSSVYTLAASRLTIWNLWVASPLLQASPTAIAAVSGANATASSANATASSVNVSALSANATEIRRQLAPEAHVNAVLIVLFLFPALLALLGVLLVLSPPRTDGYSKLRARPLSCVLFLLDAGLMGFTDAAACLLFAPSPLEVVATIRGRRRTVIQSRSTFAILLLVPVILVLASLLVVCRLRRRGAVRWSPVLRFFADARSRAVSLHRPLSMAVASAVHRSLPAIIRWCGTISDAGSVPVSGPDGTELNLSEIEGVVPWTPDGRLFGDRRKDSIAEDEQRLLRSRPTSLWQRSVEVEGMRLWIDRRAQVYEAFKQQVDATACNGVITNAQGLRLFDAFGSPLVDLCQYCLYQFPHQPWQQLVDFEAGVLHVRQPSPWHGGCRIPWVPPARDIGIRERRLIRIWLDRWLLEAEMITKARDELMWLRSRGAGAANIQAANIQEPLATLRELAIALLRGKAAFQDPGDVSAHEIENRESLLVESMQEFRRLGLPFPWEREVCKLHEHEVLATLDVSSLQGDPFPSTVSSAAFGVKRFHVRSLALPALDLDAPNASLMGSCITLAACELHVSQLGCLADWAPTFGFGVSFEALRMPWRESLAPLFASSAGPGATAAGFLSDATARLLAVVSIVALRACGFQEGGAQPSGQGVLVAWSFAELGLCMLFSSESLQARLVQVLQLTLCFALLFMQRAELFSEALLLLDAICTGSALTILLYCVSQEARALHAMVLWVRQRRTLVWPVWRTAARDDGPGRPPPEPVYGEFSAVDSHVDGLPLPFLLVVPSLGLVFHAEPNAERGICADEMLQAGCRKRFAFYERPASLGPNLRKAREGEPSLSHRLQELGLRVDEIRNAMPLVLSGRQFAGTEELRELVCTIQIVNHVGCRWSSRQHDSFLSLYKPWGLPLAGASRGHGGDSARDGVLAKWRQEVLEWLGGEIGAAENSEAEADDIVSSMLNGGPTDSATRKVHTDDRIVPGVFTDDGVGSTKFTNSRCFYEGRVLHYVLLSSELRTTLDWNPDPLAAHPAQLLCTSEGYRGSGELRPCLLRLSCRRVVYRLRRKDDAAMGGVFPPCPDPVLQDHGDMVEHYVPMFFLENLVVDVETATIVLQARKHLSLDAAQAGDAPKSLPLTFQVSRPMAEIWHEVVYHHGMTQRKEYIQDYYGSVCAHPNLPNIFCRHGTYGEQLWENRSRYMGAWEWHMYHGSGELLDSRGQTKYRGQWRRGVRHGQGTFFYSQASTRRVYEGEWIGDEFNGRGELSVMSESLDDLRAAHPQAVAMYRGVFAVACGDWTPRDLCLGQLRSDRHQALIEAHFPMLSPADGAAGPGRQEAPQQLPGPTPLDHAEEFYSLDGNDVRHCGPDEGDSEITYADGTMYTGPCLAGAIPHGQGQLTEPSGMTFVGRFEHGLRGGHGTARLPNDVTYEGEFAHAGVRHGEGQVWIPRQLQEEVGFVQYKGQYVQGCRHGQGELIFPGARTHFSDVIFYQSGPVYAGSFRNGLREGDGMLEDYDGPQFEGQWTKDLPAVSERSTIKYSTGHHYKGASSGGARQGHGSLRASAEGPELYSGQWSDDLMDGHGELHASDGMYVGQFAMGKRQGQGRFEYVNPKAGSELPPHVAGKEKDKLATQARWYEGEWANDQPHGTGSYSDEYGYLCDGASFADGKIISERRPPARGMKERYLTSSPWPRAFEPTVVLPSPSSWPRWQDEPLSRLQGDEARAYEHLKGIDEGSGVANARVRAAHLGPPDAVGARWA